MFNVEVHLRYLSRPDQYDNVPNISISRAVSPAKFVSSHISQNIYFHMIGNKSFHFMRGGGGVFPKLVYTFNRQV